MSTIRRIGWPASSTPATAPVPTLTDRQAHVLVLALRWGNAEAARRLGIHPQTVKNTLGAVYRTLGVTSKSQAALAMGWLHLPSRWAP